MRSEMGFVRGERFVCKSFARGLLHRPLHHFVVPLPRKWEAKGRSAPTAGASPRPTVWNQFRARTEAPTHKPRLCPCGARGAGRVIRIGFCRTHSVGKNLLLG